MIFKKLLKFAIYRFWKHSITSTNYVLAYQQTLEEVAWLLRLEKPKKWQKLKNGSDEKSVKQKIAL